MKKFAIKLLQSLSGEDKTKFYHTANTIVDDILMGHRDRTGKIKNLEQTKKALDYSGYYRISNKLYEAQKSIDDLPETISLYRSLTLDDMIFTTGDRFVDTIPTSYTYSEKYVYDFSIGNGGIKAIINLIYPTHLQFIPLPPDITGVECEVVLPPMSYEVVDVSENDFGENYFNIFTKPVTESCNPR